MPQHYTPVHVECYSGHRADEVPRRVHWDDRTIEVDTIVDRWVEPDYRYFKVQASDGNVYILRENVRSGSWESRAAQHRADSTWDDRGSA